MSIAGPHEKVGHTEQGLWHHKGWQLPAPIQRLANDLKEGGKDESTAIRIAVGVMKNWAAGHDGKGHKVSAKTQATAAKAIAEWEALKAKAHGGKLKEAPVGVLATRLTTDRIGDLSLLEAAADAEDKKDGGSDEAAEAKPVFCVKCKAKRTPTTAGKCPTCKADLSKAAATAKAAA